MISNRTIMRDMDVSHEQRVIAHASYSAALHRAAIDGDKLTNLVVVSHFQTGRLPGIGQILRRHADRTKRIKAIVRADRGRSLDSHVRN